MQRLSSIEDRLRRCSVSDEFAIDDGVLLIYSIISTEPAVADDA
jgi:hypothetical protein